MHSTFPLPIDPSPSMTIAGDHSDVVASATAFGDRLMEAKPGQVIVYHVGFLAWDRYKAVSELPEQQRRELNDLANYVMRLMDAGWLHLLQRRIGPERLVYLAIVRPRPRHTRRARPIPTADRLLAEVA